MRSQLVAMLAGAVLLLPHAVHAQAYWQPTMMPPVTAAAAPWQVNGEAIFYQGGFYYPVGPTEFFDGNALLRTGDYEGVPLYENRFLEPASIVYVPIGRGEMRPYERLRAGVRGGTVASRPPSFPIQRDVELSLRQPERRPARFRVTSSRADWDYQPSVTVPQPPPLTSLGGRPGATPAPGTVIRQVPTRETTNAGAYVEFEGVRYYSSGRAVRPQADQFAQAGAVKGAAVFREVRGGDRKTIYVEAVPGGALAPYTRR